MMRNTDQAFSALIDDTHQRGLPDKTLVYFVTGFGVVPEVVGTA
jgi:hypothetical protein